MSELERLERLERLHRYNSNKALTDETFEQQQDQIPYMDFSFFPVAGDVTDLAKIMDREADNFVAEETGTVPLKPCTCGQSKYADTPTLKYTDTSTLKYNNNSTFTISHPGAILLGAEPNWSRTPSPDFAPSRNALDSSLLLTDSTDDPQTRFKPIHEEKWNLRFKEFLEFLKENGHGAVPHDYTRNPKLARWVKRQRRQYKLRQDQKPSTMTTERVELLSSVGFIWDTHESNWHSKMCALKQFYYRHGHCNVPTKFKEYNLGTWVKCQRYQYKLYREGKPSAMNEDRIGQLEKLNFEWEINIMKNKDV